MQFLLAAIIELHLSQIFSKGPSEVWLSLPFPYVSQPRKGDFPKNWTDFLQLLQIEMRFQIWFTVHWFLALKKQWLCLHFLCFHLPKGYKKMCIQLRTDTFSTLTVGKRKQASNTLHKVPMRTRVSGICSWPGGPWLVLITLLPRWKSWQNSGWPELMWGQLRGQKTSGCTLFCSKSEISFEEVTLLLLKPLQFSLMVASWECAIITRQCHKPTNAKLLGLTK